MSQLLYGPVETTDILTHSIDDQPELDATGADYLWTKRTLRIRFLLSPPLAPALLGETPALTEARIRHFLEVPRSPLQFSVGNDVLIFSPAPGQIVDAHDGPFPRALEITKIHGEGANSTFHVDYTVETAQVECPGGFPPLFGGPSPPYASHRWQGNADIDENGYTILRRKGTIRTRSDITQNADSLRGIIFPVNPLPDGFKWQTGSYTLSEDGLTLEYSVVYRQVYMQPPFPATKASGSIVISTPNLNGIHFAEVQVKLEGSPNTDKSAIIKAAMTVALTKVLQVTGIPGVGINKPFPNFGIRSSAIATDLYDNTVNISIRVQLPPSAGQIFRVPPGGVPLVIDGMQIPPAGTPGPGSAQPVNFGVYGFANIMMVAAALGDPCAITQPDEPTNVNRLGPKIPNVTLGAALPPPTNTLKGSAGSFWLSDALGIFNKYVMSWANYFDNHTKGMAITAPAAPAGPTQTFCQLAPTTRTAVCNWEVERVGSKPPLPNPDLRDPNMVLLDVSIGTDQVNVDGDGTTLRWSIQGAYTYGFKDPYADSIDMGLPPNITPGVAGVTYLTTDQFGQGIINPTGAGGGVPFAPPNGGTLGGPQG